MNLLRGREGTKEGFGGPVTYLEIRKGGPGGTFQVYIFNSVQILVYFFTLKISRKNFYHPQMWGQAKYALLGRNLPAGSRDSALKVHGEARRSPRHVL